MAGAPIVETQHGRLEGRAEGGVQVFRGIRFARPPVGPLRFRAPEPPEPWAGVRPATVFGAAAPQNPMMLAMLPGMDVGPQSEDCLFLNVYTPAADAGRRPVLFWIHGGGFMIGSASQTIYDGARLARRGDVVVVTINYRLGALGFLHLADLAGEAFEASGNAGLLDQVAALRWVRDHIAAFGGDPGNVTIFGESAGGMSVGTLLGMPAARGLFARAIPQSGAAHNVHTRESATKIARLFLAELGVAPGDAARLRDLPVDAILRAQQAVSLGRGREVALLPFQPVVDGTTLPRPPIEAVREGSADAVALLIGTTRDEWRLFGVMDPEIRSLDEERLVARMARRVPEDRARDLVAAYRSSHGEASPAELFFAIETDRVFRMPAVRLAEAQHDRGAPVHKYLFTWASPAVGGILGACHAVDIPFVFGTLDVGEVGKFAGSGPEALALSAQVMDAWLGFAQVGEPGHPGLGAWPRWDTARRATMLLGAGSRVAEDPLGATRRAWEGIL